MKPHEYASVAVPSVLALPVGHEVMANAIRVHLGWGRWLGRDGVFIGHERLRRVTLPGMAKRADLQHQRLEQGLAIMEAA